MLRIGIFGNTNNYPLLLAKGLRNLGHSVFLVVNRKELLHRPESVCPEYATSYPSWITDCSDIPENDFICESTNISSVLNLLSAKSDTLILNDVGPSLLQYFDLPALSLLTGSDLTYYADYNTVDVRHDSWSEEYKNSIGGKLIAKRWTDFITRQRFGIKHSNAVSAAYIDLVSEYETVLNDIGVDAAQRIFIYISNTIDLQKKENYNTRRLRILNGSRLNWVTPLPPGFISSDLKGTDILLHGFAEFIEYGGDAELIMFRKGLDIAETEKLVKELELDKYIIWHDELSLDEYYSEMLNADIVCDQFGGSFPGMVALDALAMGIPVVTNFQPTLMNRAFPEPIPGCHARTAEDIFKQLLLLSGSVETRQSIGTAGRHFAEKYLSPEMNAKMCLKKLGLDN